MALPPTVSGATLVIGHAAEFLRDPGDLPHICLALEPGTTAVLVMEHV